MLVGAVSAMVLEKNVQTWVVTKHSGNESVWFNVEINLDTACFVPTFISTASIDGTIYRQPSILSVTTKEGRSNLSKIDGTFCQILDPLIGAYRFGDNTTLINISNVTSYPTLDFKISKAAQSSHLNVSRDNDLYKSLLFYSPFDVNTTNNTLDVLDYANNSIGALVNAPNWSDDGKFGGYYDFRNVPLSRASFPKVGANFVGKKTNFTICFWVKGRNGGFNNEVAFEFANSTTSGWQIVRWNAAAGIDPVVSVFDTGTTQYAMNFTEDWPVDQWNHYCVMFNYSNPLTNESMYLYKNGTFKRGKTFIPGVQFSFSSIAGLGIGSYPNGGAGLSSNDGFDEVMIFNRLLNKSEVMMIYQNNSQNNWSRYENNGTQMFQFININQSNSENRLNITLNSSIPNGTSLQVELWEWNGTAYNDSYDGTIMDGMWHYFHFDNRTELGEGTRVIDFAGRTNASLLNGSINTSGYKFGGSYYGRQLQDGSNFSMKNTSTFSIALWMYSVNSSASKNGRLFNSPSFDFRYASGGTGNALNTFGFTANFSGNDGIWVTAANSFFNGSWFFLVVTYNGSSTAESPNFYINGRNISTTTIGTAPTNTFQGKDELAMIGNLKERTAGFHGYLDELMIWNRTLYPEEVWDLYVKGRAKYTKKNYTWSPVGIVNEIKNFTISNLTKGVMLTINYSSNPVNFFSPTVYDGIVLNTHYFDEATTPATDTCTCVTSGDWNMVGSDNCVLSSDCVMDGSNFYCSGSGTFTLNAKLRGWTKAKIYGSCQAKCLSGNCFID